MVEAAADSLRFYEPSNRRIHALYRLMSPAKVSRVLVVEPVVGLNRDWPALGESVERYCAPTGGVRFPFDNGRFDFVILHRFDGAAHVRALMQEACRVAAPSAVVAGCLRCKIPLIDVLTFRAALSRRQLDHPRLYSLVPHFDDPRMLIDFDLTLSRKAFREILERRRRDLSVGSYWLRRLAVERGLNRFLERTLFFSGVRSC